MPAVAASVVAAVVSAVAVVPAVVAAVAVVPAVAAAVVSAVAVAHGGGRERTAGSKRADVCVRVCFSLESRRFGRHLAICLRVRLLSPHQTDALADIWAFVCECVYFTLIRQTLWQTCTETDKRCPQKRDHFVGLQ